MIDTGTFQLILLAVEPYLECNINITVTVICSWSFAKHIWGRFLILLGRYFCMSYAVSDNQQYHSTEGKYVTNVTKQVSKDITKVSK